MRRKGPLIILVVLIAGLSVIIFFLARGSRNVFTDPYSVIPEDAFAVIESADLPEFLNKITTSNGLFNELNSISEFEKTGNKIIALRDYLTKESVHSVLENNLEVLSFHMDNDGLTFPLLSVSLPPSVRYSQLKSILVSSGNARLIESGIGKTRRMKVPFSISGNNDTLHLAFSTGMLLCTTSKELLEEALSKKDKGSDIRSAPGFLRIMSASGKGQDKLFFVFGNLTKVFEKMTGGKAPVLVSGISRIAGSVEGDIYLGEDGFTLSGYADTNDSTQFMYREKYLTPGSFNTYQVLPSSTVMFETHLIDDGSQISKGIKEERDDTENLLGMLLPYFGGEVTEALIDIKGNTTEDNFIVVYELKNREIAERILADAMEKYNSPLRADDQRNIQFFQPDDITSIPVYSTPFKGLFSCLFDDWNLNKADSLFTFFDNYMITGSSFLTLSRFLHDNILNNTFANDVAYRDFESRLPSRAGYYFYCVPSQIINVLENYFNKQITDVLLRSVTPLKKIQAVGYQYAASNDMVYNTLTLKYQEVAREESATEWATLLDSSACIKPFFFTNHNTGAREIFIQDYKNNVYLINAAGRVLWKVLLNERIMSNIYMIDFYRNGKFQILFAGNNYLHLLDRNGNYVERYPVRLRSPASGPMTLFDYENNGDYRIVVPGEDKIIYVYDKSGSVVKGWKQFRTNGLVTSEIHFFRVSGKDYIIASDENTVYFLDRTGNVRVRLKEPVTRAAHSEMRLNSGTESYLVFTSPDGIIQNVSFDGSVRKMEVRKFSVDHSFDFFDIDGDAFGEYIFIDSGKLYLYDHDRSEIFVRDFGTDDLGGPIIFTFSAFDKKIGVFNNKEKLIYLIDRNGDTVNGFPLQGASMFSIGKLSDKGGFQLIVGSSDNFLYNYKLNIDNI